MKFLWHTSFEMSCGLSRVRVSIRKLFDSLLVVLVLIVKVSEDLIELSLHFLNISVLIFLLLIVFVLILHFFHLLNPSHLLLSKLGY